MIRGSMDSLFYGIDLGISHTVSSYAVNPDGRPETVSLVMGVEDYLIPTSAALSKNGKKWLFGRDALRACEAGQAAEARDLLKSAVHDMDVSVLGERFHARDILSEFLRYVMELNGVPLIPSRIGCVSVTLDDISKEITESVIISLTKLGIGADRIIVSDHIESFCYYSLSQGLPLKTGSIALFDARGLMVRSFILTHDDNLKPSPVKIKETQNEMGGVSRDAEFMSLCRKVLDDTDVKTVYLVGDGFDGGWLDLSREYLLKGRRVFIGKNLYSKGICLDGMVSKGRSWEYSYIGDHDLKFTLSVKVNDVDGQRYLKLLSSGTSSYSSRGNVDVIITGSPEISFYIQKSGQRSALEQNVKLRGLGSRDNIISRLSITATPTSDRTCNVKIVDHGFGEISPGTGREWNIEVSSLSEE